MASMLKSNWTIALIGAAVYFLTMASLVSSVLTQMAPAREPHELKDKKSPPGPSWTFHDPEVDRLVEELRSQTGTLAKRRAELEVLESRVRSEKGELEHLRKEVDAKRAAFSVLVNWVQDQEQVNFKKLVTLYAAMDPASAVKILEKFEDDKLAKILSLMTEKEAAAILQAFVASDDAAEAERAARLTERLRLSIPVQKEQSDS